MSARSALALVLAPLAAPGIAAQKEVWVRQIGAQASETVLAAAPDGAGGAYSAGFAHNGPAGDDNALLARHDAAGALLWSGQIVTPDDEQALAACPDGAGGVFVGGVTTGALGGPHAGSDDAWLARYDAAGGRLWIVQFKVADPANWDYLTGLVTDGSTGVLAAGYTHVPGPEEEIWIARFDAAGNRLWTRRYGPSLQDLAFAAAPDGAGGAYVAGRANLGVAGFGFWDAWVARYDAAGAELWRRDVGTPEWDEARALALGPDGVLVVGRTRGDLGRPSLGGFWDAWTAYYDEHGGQVSIRQVGTVQEDHGYAATRDGAGGWFAGGTTRGALGGPSAGAQDAWLARYEPASLTYCTAKTNSCGGAPAIRRVGAASATEAAGFVVSCDGARPGKTGILLYSGSGRGNAPFFGGILCIDPGMGRRAVPVVAAGGTQGACDAVLAIDVNAFAAGLLGGNQPAWLTIPGQVIDAQWWGRDTIANGPLLSDALEWIVCP